MVLESRVRPPCCAKIALATSMSFEFLRASYLRINACRERYTTAMSLASPAINRCCFRSLRSSAQTSAYTFSLATQHRIWTPLQRWQSTTVSSGNVKIAGIVDQISQLTLLETADLVSTLKVCIFKLRRSFSPAQSYKTHSNSFICSSRSSIFLTCLWEVDFKQVQPLLRLQRP